MLPILGQYFINTFLLRNLLVSIKTDRKRDYKNERIRRNKLYVGSKMARGK